VKTLLLSLIAALSSAATAASPPGTYKLATTIPLGAPDRWDYVVYDGATNRVYVAHGDRLSVVDPATDRLAGEVKGIAGGTHGTAISVATRQGFTDDGKNGKAVAFDLASLQVKREIAAEADADAMTLDPVTGHVFVIEGDPAAMTVIDPATDTAIATVKAGEKLEYAAADGRGAVYVAGNGAGDVLKIDARSNKLVARWPTADCSSPHGLAVDAPTRRLFMGCVNNVMMVVDTASGRVVARLPIGSGSDAVAFDSVRRRVFSSNGRDGTITAYQQLSADRYRQLPVIQTLVSARTMAVDPKTGRLFVAGADTRPNPTPGGRPSVRPGSLRLMVFEPQS